MLQPKHNNIDKYIISIATAILFFSSSLVQAGNELSKLIGYASLALMAAVAFADLVYKLIITGEMKLDRVASSIFLYFLLTCFGMVSLSTSPITFIINILFFLVFYLSLINMLRFSALESALSALFVLFCIISIINYLTLVEQGKYSFIFNNSNTLGMFSFMGSYFILSQRNYGRKVRFLFCLIVLANILISGSRSALGAYLIVISGPFFLPVILRIGPKKLYLMLMSIFFSVAIFYMNIRSTEIGSVITNLSRLYLEKNLYSGRQEIWSAIVESMSFSDYFTGKGTAVLPSTVTGMELSAHNSYLQIIFQNGVFALLAILAMLYFALPSKAQLENDNTLKYSFIYIVAISFCALWEVFLLQNHPVISILVLIILASSYLNKRKADI